MKKRFSEQQIIGFLREAEAGVAIRDLCRRLGWAGRAFTLKTSNTFRSPDVTYIRADDE